MQSHIFGRLGATVARLLAYKDLEQSMHWQNFIQLLHRVQSLRSGRSIEGIDTESLPVGDVIH